MTVKCKDVCICVLCMFARIFEWIECIGMFVYDFFYTHLTQPGAVTECCIIENDDEAKDEGDNDADAADDDTV